MTIDRIGTVERMSQVVIHAGTAYLAGQVASNAVGSGVAEQTAEILGKIDTLLAQAGTEKSRVLTATIWLADIEGFAEMNNIWDSWVTAGTAPARSTVEARLAAPQYLVEIAVIAAL